MSEAKKAEEKRNSEIRKEDNSKKTLFGIVIACSMALGGVLGFLLASGETTIDRIWELLSRGTQTTGIFFTLLMIIVGFALWGYGTLRLRSLKKLWADEEARDDNWDYIENKLSDLCTITSIAIIVNLFLYGCAVYNVGGKLRPRDPMTGLNLAYSVSFVAAIVLMLAFSFAFFYLQKKIVDFEKIMNPEKAGSLYDLRFRKKWYESFDEAEKQQAGIAGYKATMIVSSTCAIMSLLWLCIGMVLNVTLLPLLSIVTIWLILVITFGIESKKAMEKMK